MHIRIIKKAAIVLFFCLYPSMQLAAADLLGNLASSPGNIKLGPLLIHPGVLTSASYDDNIYNTPDKKVGDVIFLASPGLFISTGNHYKGSLGYALDYNKFQSNGNEDFTGHTVKAELELVFPSRLHLNMGNRTSLSKLPRSRSDAPIRSDYTQNSFNTAIGYRTFSNKLNGDISYNNNRIVYDDKSDSLNNNGNEAGLFLAYNIMPKTAILFNYGYALEKFPKSKDNIDSTSNIISSGIKYDISNKIVTTIIGGFHMKNMDNSKFKDHSDFLISGDISYKMAIFGKSKIDLLINRDIKNSTYQGNSESNISRSTFYVQTDAGIRYSTQFTHKISLNMRTNYSINDYIKLESSQKARKDTVISGGPDLSYTIYKGMKFKLSYNILKVTSNDKNRKQTNNKISLEFAAVF